MDHPVGTDTTASSRLTTWQAASCVVGLFLAMILLAWVILVIAFWGYEPPKFD